MKAPEKTISPETTRADTLARLRAEAHYAQECVVRFDRRGKPLEVRYYGGMRDGLLRAITMLENE